jgi:hypothetical protein
MILDISWKDFFLDEMLDLMPPGCGFSVHHGEASRVKNWDTERDYDYLLFWRGQELGMMRFHKAAVEFLAFNDPDKKYYWKVEINNPTCTPETLSKVIAEVINAKRGEYFREKGIRK